MAERHVLHKVGKKIRISRLNNKMTLDDLAAKCNFEKAQLSRIENGQGNPTVRSLNKICLALDITMSDLFCE